MGKKAKWFALAAVVAIVGAFLLWRFVFRTPAPELDQSVDTGRARVEVAFDYAKQGGMASNQIAAWVTDGDGKIVKTLFATNFPAGRGGWQSRKESLSQWVADSGIARMDKAGVDAVSRATPQSGTIRCAWYCDGPAGKPVPEGLYTVNVEGSLRWENRVLYQAEVRLYGESGEERPEPVFFGPDAAERGMLTNVVVRFHP